MSARRNRDQGASRRELSDLLHQIGVKGVRLLSCWVHLDVRDESLCNQVAQTLGAFQQVVAFPQYWLSMNCSSSSLLLLKENTP